MTKEEIPSDVESLLKELADFSRSGRGDAASRVSLA
jgi:hypothetical protein